MKICTYCGHTTDDSLGQTACFGCGRELPEQSASGEIESRDAVPVNPLGQQLPPPFPTPAEEFVGARADYYVESWNRIDASGNAGATFNWAAFFLTGYWMAYRKMYGWALAVLVGRQIVRWLLSTPGLPKLAAAGISTTICLLCGFYGNALYKKYVSARLAEIPVAMPEHRRREWIRSRGGTDPWMPWVFLAMILSPYWLRPLLLQFF